MLLLHGDGTGFTIYCCSTVAAANLRATSAIGPPQSMLEEETAGRSHVADASKESSRRLVSSATVSPDLMVLGNEPRVGLRLHAQF